MAAQPDTSDAVEATEAPSIRLKRAPAPGRVRFEVSTLLGQPRAERKIATALAELPGVRTVEARALTGNVLVLFDADRWTPDSLLEASGEALGVRPVTSPPRRPRPADGRRAAEVEVRSVVPSGRVRLTVPGLRRAPERERRHRGAAPADRRACRPPARTPGLATSSSCSIQRCARVDALVVGVRRVGRMATSTPRRRDSGRACARSFTEAAAPSVEPTVEPSPEPSGAVARASRWPRPSSASGSISSAA